MSEIILSPDQIINQPSLAILIDCWDKTSSGKTNMLGYSILPVLENSPHIQTIVLASYNCRTEKLAGEFLWHHNYFGQGVARRSGFISHQPPGAESTHRLFATRPPFVPRQSARKPVDRFARPRRRCFVASHETHRHGQAGQQSPQGLGTPDC